MRNVMVTLFNRKKLYKVYVSRGDYDKAKKLIEE